MKVPSTPWTLMYRIYREVIPNVHDQLNGWRQWAEAIPNDELRAQALASIETKTFHCEGGGIYSLLAKGEQKSAVRFIVAYQTISDYLDNLCDRSTSLDQKDFRALHEAMLDALTPGAQAGDYYRFRDEREDGGYLQALVETCQDVLATLPSFDKIQKQLLELATYYCDLQVYKHVKEEARVPLLEEWYAKHQHQLPQMTWYEFSACAGSTLGVFCLVAYAFDASLTEDTANRIRDGYFPWVQGLHILLDYFIDQEEDRKEGDLNFCFYYPNGEEMLKRFRHFVIMANKSIATLPHKQFHSLINKGLTAMYLADEKVAQQKKVKREARQIIRFGGMSSVFFYINCYVYRRIR